MPALREQQGQYKTNPLLKSWSLRVYPSLPTHGCWQHLWRPNCLWDSTRTVFGRGRSDHFLFSLLYSLDEVSLDSAHLTPALSVPRKPSKCDSHATTTQGHSADSSPKRYLLKDALTLTPGSARHCQPRGGFAGNLGWGSGVGDADGQDPAHRLPEYAGIAESFSPFLWSSMVKRVQ